MQIEKNKDWVRYEFPRPLKLTRQQWLKTQIIFGWRRDNYIAAKGDKLYGFYCHYEDAIDFFCMYWPKASKDMIRQTILNLMKNQGGDVNASS